jgi:predicted RNA binding protein YcfA (HicA-like mRNA interferase family)
MPSVTARELVAFLRAQGFAEDRQSGSHVTLVHPERGSVTVPRHPGADLGRGLAARILKDAGFSVDDFIALR